MTCHEFYSARMADAGHGVAVWTRETTLEVLRLFVQEEGRWPVTADCRPVHGLPYVDTILRVWQSLAAWRRAGQAAGIGGAAPGEGLLVMVRCLRCGEAFPSPDKRQVRCCPTCSADPRWEEGAWLPGLVIHNGTHSLAIIEEEEALW